MTINVDKTKLGLREVDFVGHRVFSAGVRPFASNIDALAKMNALSDAAELRRFFGDSNFYRIYVRGFTENAESLVELLRNDW